MLLRWLIALSIVVGTVCYPAADVKAQEFYLGCEVIQQVSREECEALEIFFQSTEGYRWNRQRGWLASNQPCGWFGIQCNSKEWPLNITKIILLDNNVGGRLPVELSRLTELTHLVIENVSQGGFRNFLGGTLPPGLSTLQNLEVLRLSRNEIVGDLPDVYGELKSLRELSLNENQLDDFLPATLGNLPNLEILNLSSNRFRGRIPGSLGKLQKLRVIDLSDNLLTDVIPDSVGEILNLRNLNLSSNELTGRIPHGLGRLDSLQSVNFSNNNLLGPLSPLAAQRFATLASCSLENNSINLCIPDREVYRDMSNGASICGLSLDPECTFCKNSPVVSEASCVGLESLFYETRGQSWLNKSEWLIKSSPCDWFGIGCEGNEVTQLILPNNNLSGQLPAELGELSSLDVLDLSGNTLRGAIPLSIAALGTTTRSCSLERNDASLCIPAETAYTELGFDSICQLPLANTCTADIGIQILTFTATAEDRSVTLSWTTSTGSSLVSYDIEKKENGAFVTLTSLNGIAQPSGNQTYATRLDNLKDGLHIFRLRQRNGDTSYSISEEVEVIVGLEAGIVVESLYPNPFFNTATLRLASADEQQLNVWLYNALGQRVKSLFDGRIPALSIQRIDLDASSLSSGSYFIQIKGESFSKTVMATVVK